MEIRKIEAARPHLSIIFRAGWHLLVCALLAGAAIVALRMPVRPPLDAEGLVQVLLLVLGYLALSLNVVPASQRPLATVMIHMVVAALVGFGGAYAGLKLARLPASPWLFVAGGAAATIFGLLPHLPRKGRLWALVLLALLAVAVVTGRSLRSTAQTVERTEIDTALYPLNEDVFTGLIPAPGADGGALEPGPRGLILVTGDAKFYWIRQTGMKLDAAALSIPAPMDRAAYLRQFKDPKQAPRLRVTDVVFGREPGQRSLFVAHQAWHQDKHCYTMQVSEIPLSWSARGLPQANGRWRTDFESAPCLKAEGAFDDSETGGRLAWGPDGQLLVTLGEFGFEGLNGGHGISQVANADYGRILSIDPATLQRSVVSIGHRNPQGLTVTRGGEIWEAEHGPQGGDEVNFIVKGANYGWPLVTYGTNYGTKVWALNPDSLNHGGFHEPSIAFVPSMAISALIEIGGAEFPHWNGDLLAGALRMQSIYRIRHRGDRVIYVEQVWLGHRIRDLVQTADGKILLWSDDGTLILLSRRQGADAFERFCSGCHAPKFGAAVGPSLTGVVGRRVGSVEGYVYSPALRNKGGVWSEQNLDTFLRDPRAFAPGTTMKLYGLDDKSRKEVIAELAKGRH